MCDLPGQKGTVMSAFYTPISRGYVYVECEPGPPGTSVQQQRRDVNQLVRRVAFVRKRVPHSVPCAEWASLLDLRAVGQEVSLGSWVRYKCLGSYHQDLAWVSDYDPSKATYTLFVLPRIDPLPSSVRSKRRRVAQKLLYAEDVSVSVTSAESAFSYGSDRFQYGFLVLQDVPSYRLLDSGMFPRRKELRRFSDSILESFPAPSNVALAQLFRSSLASELSLVDSFGFEFGDLVVVLHRAFRHLTGKVLAVEGRSVRVEIELPSAGLAVETFSQRWLIHRVTVGDFVEVCPGDATGFTGWIASLSLAEEVASVIECAVDGFSRDEDCIEEIVGVVGFWSPFALILIQWYDIPLRCIRVRDIPLPFPTPSVVGPEPSQSDFVSTFSPLVRLGVLIVSGPYKGHMGVVTGTRDCPVRHGTELDVKTTSKVENHSLKLHESDVVHDLCVYVSIALLILAHRVR